MPRAALLTKSVVFLALDCFLAGADMNAIPSMRDMFCQYVAQVELEVSTYCNRHCSFCSNSVADRRGGNRYMDDALYSGILRQLSDLGWSGVLSFHRYNEPLADRPYILRRIDEAKRSLPNALLRIYTNGDYLNQGYCEDLYAVGLRSMVVSAYPAETRSYSGVELRHLAEQSAARLGLPYKVVDECEGEVCIRILFGDMNLTLQARDYTQVTNGKGEILAYDRGGTVPLAVAYQRVSPCFRPFLELQVECDGTVMPCCNLRSDVEVHSGCAITRLTPETDILEVWGGKAFSRWRQSMLNYEPKSSPCAGCAMHVLGDTPDNRLAVKQLRQLYSSLG